MKKTLLTILLIVPVGLSASDWRELSTKLEQSVWASSTYCEEIRGKQVCYPPEQLFDGDPGTCWVEAAPGNGVGEWVLFLVNRPVRALRLVNGFARSQSLYENNNRIKGLRLSFAVGFTAPGLVSELDYYLHFVTDLKQAELELEDTMEPQPVDFAVSYEEHEDLIWEALDRFYDSHPLFMREIEKDLGLEPNISKEELKHNQDLIFDVFGMSCLRLEILEVYPGDRYDDTCLAEISTLFE
ncbi:MAG: hypothetical protein V3V57_00705 [Spirochaetia bacterium]